MFAKATPQSKAGSTDPANIARSQLARQRTLSTLPRNSKQTPRMISATKMISSGR
jgi:hypothetical protein